MRNEKEAQAGEDPSHTCCPNAPHNCLITNHVSPYPPLNLDVNLVKAQTCGRKCHLNLFEWAFQGESGVKFEPAENSHHVCNKVQEINCEEILPDNIKGRDKFQTRSLIISVTFNHRKSDLVRAKMTKLLSCLLYIHDISNFYYYYYYF